MFEGMEYDNWMPYDRSFVKTIDNAELSPVVIFI